jgi:hypothetical protein
LALLSACLRQPRPPATTDERADHYTQAAETFIAQLTAEAGATAVAHLTELAVQSPQPPKPTEPANQTTSALPIARDTPLPPTSTPLPPTPTATQTPCDQAHLVGDISIPPDTLLPTGARFTKIWRLLNVGTCTWTPDYALEYVGGDRMGGITVFTLPRAVNPGEELDISAVLTVPSYVGVYQSEWMLRHPSGITFGVGSDGLIPLYVRIHAIQSSGYPEGTLDFASEYCAAEWRSAVGSLACPGNNQDDRGAVILLNQPSIESGLTQQYALWTRPNQTNDGWISGTYPTYSIRDHDHFRAQVGCLDASPGCNVVFRLDFNTPDGVTTELGSWREIYDGLTTEINIDISHHRGKSGNFVLSVRNLGSPESADAVWIAPRVQNMPPSTTLALTWAHEGQQEDSCDEMQIRLSGLGIAEARATYCADGDEYIVNSPLTVDELAQLLAWLQRLDKFQAEIYQASPVQPLISWIDFNGQGTDTAHDTEIQAINRFAVQLFDRLTNNP